MVDGFDAEAIVGLMERESLGWMLLMPGSIEPVVELMQKTGRRARSIRAVGAMIDLVPRALAAELSRLTGAPYLNSFGSTETGLPPASSYLIPPGELPASLSKRASSMIEIRLVDPDDREVAVGDPGEVCVRGPTLFSGYWAAEETNARDFRGGWFHMGDMFRRNADGTYDFVDRVKYMIKSGGENIYPAEIERVLLADPRISDAVIVRKHDPKWGRGSGGLRLPQVRRADRGRGRCALPCVSRRVQAPEGGAFPGLRGVSPEHDGEDIAPRDGKTAGRVGRSP